VKKKIYTAGPITGLTYEGAALGWREQIKALLPEFDLFSPMRAKEFLAGEGVLAGSYGYNPMSSENGILGRDHNDVFTCDLMIANFLEDDGNKSLGTAMEFGWAHAYRKPIIMIAEQDNPHRQHPMLRGASVYVVETLDEAAILAKHLLLPTQGPVIKRLWDALPGVKSLRLSLVDTNRATGDAEVVVDIIDHETLETLYTFGKVKLENGSQFITIKLDAEVEITENATLDPKYGKLIKGKGTNPGLRVPEVEMEALDNDA
jgi:nucleoside 2-deoxyribosyltransferase